MTDQNARGYAGDADEGTALNAAPAVAVAPIEDKLTLHPDDSTEAAPTTEDGRPQAFVPGDQTAAGALTPPEGQHPGEPSTTPGHAANVLDPYGVNGTRANAEAIKNGTGIEHPDRLEQRDPTKDHPRGDD